MLLQDFYSVIQSKKEEGKVITHIRINKNHELYKGHFPDRPVTPGVVLMHMFREEMERQTGRKLRFSKASNVKFMAVVDPNIDDVLIMEYETEENEEVITLKAITKNNGSIALKINAFYN
ncbi:hydroxymyristoyl-ACP dehydratase [Zunongwangia sp. F363]|uniref:Hydroxymyristoyl-ACP dehydratase n=1 Tax=Autumnicola tepida TaxID=3075595 RepID=A0ABU3C6E0_9FLAO|nr:hydroxymyristoyl-ACP dehydratase [Zunongwangia sp. F363]MDT0641879.1 hydroxymyristoyl-ACP dehydratase [Zunongwangia sp. F363]